MVCTIAIVTLFEGDTAPPCTTTGLNPSQAFSRTAENRHPQNSHHQISSTLRLAHASPTIPPRISHGRKLRPLNRPFEIEPTRSMSCLSNATSNAISPRSFCRPTSPRGRCRRGRRELPYPSSQSTVHRPQRSGLSVEHEADDGDHEQTSSSGPPRRLEGAPSISLERGRCALPYNGRNPLLFTPIETPARVAARPYANAATRRLDRYLGYTLPSTG